MLAAAGHYVEAASPRSLPAGGTFPKVENTFPTELRIYKSNASVKAYRDGRVQTKVFWANFEGSYLNEFGSVDPLRWRVFQSPLNNT